MPPLSDSVVVTIQRALEALAGVAILTAVIAAYVWGVVPENRLLLVHYIAGRIALGFLRVAAVIIVLLVVLSL